MLGILFLFLGLIAAKVAVWQSGLLAGIFGMSAPPDHAVGALSFAAAVIFFGLWQASRTPKERIKRNIFTD